MHLCENCGRPAEEGDAICGDCLMVDEDIEALRRERLEDLRAELAELEAAK